MPAFVREYLDDGELHQDSTSIDWLRDQYVWLPPMLAVLAWRHHEVHPQLPLAHPPLTRSFMDMWRQGQCTESIDVLLLALRLKLLYAGGRPEVAAPLDYLLPGTLPAQLRKRTVMVELPAAGGFLHPPVNLPASVQLSDREYQRLCKQSSYGGDFLYLRPGDSGPDGWMVLQLVDREPLVIVVQSKKRMQPGRLTAARVVAEADKRRSGKLSQLLVLVTDDAADTIAIEAEVISLKPRVPVVVVGPSTHKQYYAQAGAFVKSCFAVSQAASDAVSDACNRQELLPDVGS